MGFSVELQVDQVAGESIRFLRGALMARGIRGLNMEYEYHPHVTLGYLEGEPSGAAYDVVRSLAPRIGEVSFAIGSVGVFPGDKTSVVFLSPVPSQELLEAHALAHGMMESTLGAMGSHYQKGQWVPHMTLGEKVPNGDVPLIVSSVREIQAKGFPSRGVFDKLVLATDRPMLVVPMSVERFPSLEGEFSRDVARSRVAERGR